MQDIEMRQASAEVPLNENFRSVIPGELFAYDPTASSGLTFGYKGGQWFVNGALSSVSDDDVTLTDNAVNYVGVTQAGVVVAGTTQNPLHAPLYVVTTASGLVTVMSDVRNSAALARHAHGIASQALTTVNVTITQAQALCQTLVVTGALTASRDLIVPLVRRRWVARHTGTGFDMRIVGATGTGVTIGIGKTAIVECDGTNVYRITADV